jgi:hypothetical protein
MRREFWVLYRSYNFFYANGEGEIQEVGTRYLIAWLESDLDEECHLCWKPSTTCNLVVHPGMPIRRTQCESRGRPYQGMCGLLLLQMGSV